VADTQKKKGENAHADSNSLARVNTEIAAHTKHRMANGGLYALNATKNIKVIKI